jgi:hypothetical protein
MIFTTCDSRVRFITKSDNISITSPAYTTLQSMRTGATLHKQPLLPLHSTSNSHGFLVAIAPVDNSATPELVFALAFAPLSVQSKSPAAKNIGHYRGCQERENIAPLRGVWSPQKSHCSSWSEPRLRPKFVMNPIAAKTPCIRLATPAGLGSSRKVPPNNRPPQLQLPLARALRDGSRQTLANKFQLILLKDSIQ